MTVTTSTSTSSELCRLVVLGPRRRVEIAVPAQVAIADLLPALLPYVGEGLPDAGLAHGGWVLQRLGEPPLDEEGTAASLGLTDGSVVHLRPRSDQIPPVDFDDLADGLATGLRERSGQWRPEMARSAGAGLLSLLLAATVPALAEPGPPGPRVAVAAALAAALLGGSAAFTRAFGDRTFGLVSGLGSAVIAGLAAAITPQLAPGGPVSVLGGTQLLAGSVVAGLVAVLAAMLSGRSGPVYAAVVAAAVVAAAGTIAVAFFGESAAQGAAVAAVVASVLSVTVPRLAMRLARVRVDPLPTKPEHLQEDIDPEPSGEVMSRAAVADAYMTGVHAGLAAALLVALIKVPSAGGWAAYTVVLLVAVARLLSARDSNSAWHRLALALPAVAGLLMAGLDALEGVGSGVRLLIVLGVVPAMAVLLYGVSSTVPERRMMPIWGRLGDALRTIAMISLLPVTAVILGVYGAARAIGG